jgi:hypothetical protein
MLLQAELEIDEKRSGSGMAIRVSPLIAVSIKPCRSSEGVEYPL